MVARRWDVLVIGTGVIGLATALACEKAGLRVALVGKDRGASACATGLMVRKGLFAPRQKLLASKWRGAMGFYDFFRSHSHSSELPWAWGVYEPFVDKDHYRFLRQRIFHNLPSALWDMEVLSGEAWRAEIVNKGWSALQGSLGAFFYPRDGRFSPSLFLKSLEESFQGPLSREAVVCIRAGSPSVVMFQNSEEWRADHVVIAAGSQTSFLLEKSGLMGGPLNLTYTHGQMGVESCPENSEFFGWVWHKGVMAGWGERRYAAPGSSFQGDFLKGERCRGPGGFPLLARLSVPGWIGVSCGYHRSAFYLAQEAAEVTLRAILGSGQDDEDGGVLSFGTLR